MNEQYIDTIHRYLNGNMEAAERATFEEELNNNDALRSDVELEELLLAGIETAGNVKIRATIGTVHQELKNTGFFESAAQTSPLKIPYFAPGNRLKQFIAIAATFVVVAGAIWFFTKNGAGPNEALFANFYHPADDIGRAGILASRLKSFGMTGVQTYTDSLAQALQNFEAGQYDETLALLVAIGTAHPQNDTIQYFTGAVQIRLNQYDQAIETLLPLSQSQASALRNDALWNLGLCYLKTKNGASEARAVFSRLARENNYPQQNEAQSILDQLPAEK